MGQTDTHKGQMHIRDRHTQMGQTHTWGRHTHMGQSHIDQIYAKTFLFVHQSPPKYFSQLPQCQGSPQKCLVLKSVEKWRRGGYPDRQTDRKQKPFFIIQIYPCRKFQCSPSIYPLEVNQFLMSFKNHLCLILHIFFEEEKTFILNFLRDCTQIKI